MYCEKSDDEKGLNDGSLERIDRHVFSFAPWLYVHLMRSPIFCSAWRLARRGLGHYPRGGQGAVKIINQVLLRFEAYR
jgi:hypothetical protein